MNWLKVFSPILLFPVLALPGWGQENLSDQGRANSYLISGSGPYVIDCTRKGEDGGLIEGISGASLLWSDPPGLVSKVAYRDGKAYFTASEEEGKAVIAVVDKDGEYLWSWLIWKRSVLPSDRLCVNHDYGRYVLMDAFLGETSGRSPAFFLWGKERAYLSADTPAPQSPGSSFQRDAWGDGAGYYKLYGMGGWSGEKSSSDPCPKGYRVANSHTFTGFTLWGDNTSRSYEMNVTGDVSRGFRFCLTRADEEGMLFTPFGAEENKVWCSNPYHLNKDAGACFAYGKEGVAVRDYDAPEHLHPVRCVLVDDLAESANKDAEMAWKSPVLSDFAGEYADLSVSERANSYIVLSKGNYRFDARFKGNSKKKTGKPVKAELLWTDVPCMLANVRLDEDGFIRFSLHRIAGNALIAIKDNHDDILWSWHIWAPGEEIRIVEWYNNKNFVSHIMDRNLGALPGKNLECMLYQWGRKDPFPNANRAFVGENMIAQRRFSDVFPAVACSRTGDEAHNNMIYAVSHPCTVITSDNNEGTWYPFLDSEIPYLWGDPRGFVAEFREAGRWSEAKSMNDPCPPGYRVSNSGTFTGMTKTGAATSDPRQFRVEGGCESGWQVKTREKDYEIMWFPLSGWILPATGQFGSMDSRGALWHSNPTGSDMKKMRRTMYHSSLFLPESSDTAAYGYAVRCVKE